MDDDIGIHFDARGMGWQKTYFDGTNPALLNRLKAMPYKEEPWRSRYPQLPGISGRSRRVCRQATSFMTTSAGAERWVDYRDKLTEKNMDSAGNHVYPETGSVGSGHGCKGMGLDIDTQVVVRRLTQDEPDAGKAHHRKPGTKRADRCVRDVDGAGRRRQDQ